MGWAGPRWRYLMPRASCLGAKSADFAYALLPVAQRERAPYLAWGLTRGHTRR